MALMSSFTITLLGDLMLGRLIDQLLPTHVDEPEEAEIISNFHRRNPHLEEYSYATPWGNALSLLKSSDLVMGNLETSVTTHNTKWPNKVFNYRMHPDNVRCLQEAGIDYVSLANNHTLDFSKEGLFETVQALKRAGIAFAGAGENASEAENPAVLTLTAKDEFSSADGKRYKVFVYSFSDHPFEWSRVDEFNHLDYSNGSKQRLRHLMSTNASDVSLKIVSIHWGPNYRWQPSFEMRDMAHHLIDSCGADVIWGHSSHHIQGVEIYNEKLIIYGCGDFIDDYAVNYEYRNDLSAAWKLIVGAGSDEGPQSKLCIRRLEMWPNRIKHFQAGLLDRNDKDHDWVTKKFKTLSYELGTKVKATLGEGGQTIVDLAKQ